MVFYLFAPHFTPIISPCPLNEALNKYHIRYTIMHISLFYCVQVFLFIHFFFVFTFSNGPETKTCSPLFFFCCAFGVVVVDMHDVVHKCFSLCKFCIFNSLYVLRNETMTHSTKALLIRGENIVLHCRSGGKMLRATVTEFMGDSVKHNEWIFSAIKVQKRRIVCLCGVKSKFIYCSVPRQESRKKTAFFTYERRTMPQNCAIFLVLNS